MRHIIRGSPDYSSGYSRLDKHGVWKEATLKTADSGNFDSYLGEDLPCQIMLSLQVRPVRIDKAVMCALTYDEEQLPEKNLYPDTRNYIAGIQFISDGSGSYYDQGHLRPFHNYQIQDTEILTENNILYQKDFIVQHEDIYQKREEGSPYILFPYAGVLAEHGGVEAVQQIYAALFHKDKKTFIHVKTPQAWKESGYHVPGKVPTLGQDILNGRIELVLKQGNFSFPYKSIAYQQVDERTLKTNVYFARKTIGER